MMRDKAWQPTHTDTDTRGGRMFDDETVAVWGKKEERSMA